MSPEQTTGWLVQQGVNRPLVLRDDLTHSKPAKRLTHRALRRVATTTLEIFVPRCTRQMDTYPRLGMHPQKKQKLTCIFFDQTRSIDSGTYIGDSFQASAREDCLFG